MDAILYKRTEELLKERYNFQYFQRAVNLFNTCESIDIHTIVSWRLSDDNLEFNYGIVKQIEKKFLEDYNNNNWVWDEKLVDLS